MNSEFDHSFALPCSSFSPFRSFHTVVGFDHSLWSFGGYVRHRDDGYVFNDVLKLEIIGPALTAPLDAVGTPSFTLHR